MLYLFYGNDTDEVRRKAQAVAGKMLAKETNASLERYDSETVSVERLRELAQSQSLFDAESVVACQFILTDENVKRAVAELLPEFVVSSSVFVFAEADLDKKTVAAFEKAGGKAEEISRTFKKQQGFNVFALSDALGARDKKTLWVLYQKALQADLSPEEIHGLLMWQVKSLALVESVKGDSVAATKTGLNPFVFRKAQGNLRNFKSGELPAISSELVTMYHEARRGGAPLEVALERFILSL